MKTGMKTGMKTWEKALKNGREIVIVSRNLNYNSAIFYAKDGKVYAFTRELGEIEHTKTIAEAAEWAAKCEANGDFVFCRG